MRAYQIRENLRRRGAGFSDAVGMMLVEVHSRPRKWVLAPQIQVEDGLASTLFENKPTFSSKLPDTSW